MEISKTLSRIVGEFGFLGWVEVIAALLVAVGCLGELWIILNKLTKHVEPLAKSAGRFWKVLAWSDSVVRPVVVRLKIKGRKLPEVKEQLLERLFVMLVGLGVGIEFICLMFSLHEIATLNEEASQARKEAAEANERAGKANQLAGQANEQAATTESNNLVLRSNVVVLEAKLQPRRITMDNRQKFISLLRDTPKGPIFVWSSSFADEAIAYRNAIRSLLNDAGYVNKEQTSDVLAGAVPLYPERMPSDVNVVFIGSKNLFPAYTMAVSNAFRGIGIHTLLLDGHIHLSPGQLGVLVLERN